MGLAKADTTRPILRTLLETNFVWASDWEAFDALTLILVFPHITSPTWKDLSSISLHSPLFITLSFFVVNNLKYR